MQISKGIISSVITISIVEASTTGSLESASFGMRGTPANWL